MTGADSGASPALRVARPGRRRAPGRYNGRLPRAHGGARLHARPDALKKSDFHYELPEELIAQAPLAERSARRMLLVPPGGGAFADLGEARADQ